jgi:hypothetical protein
MLAAERQVQHGCEPMDPFTDLRLAHAEEEGLDMLERIDFEVEQDEQQLIGAILEDGLAAATALALAWLRMPSVSLLFQSVAIYSTSYFQSSLLGALEMSPGVKRSLDLPAKGIIVLKLRASALCFAIA